MTLIDSRPNRLYRSVRPPEFDGDAATAARHWVLDQVQAVPARILTAPGHEGHCARLFRQAWPDAEIIGIDQLQGVVSASQLSATGGPLDQFYKVALWGVVNNRVPQVRSGNGLRPVAQAPFDYGKFDLAFLDFGDIIRSVRSEVGQFVRQNVTPRGLVALTCKVTPGKPFAELLICDGLMVRDVREYRAMGTTFAVALIQA